MRLFLHLFLLRLLGLLSPSVTGMPVAGDTGNTTSYTTAAVTLTSGKLYLLYVFSTVGATGNRVDPTITHNAGTNPGTFTEVISSGDIEASNRRTVLFRCLPTATSSSGTLTISYGALAQTGCTWILVEVTDPDTSGTNGSGAIVQAKAATSDVADITLTFDAGITSGNSVIAGVGSTAGNGSAGGVIAPGGTHGYTEITETGYNTPASALQSQWKLAGAQSCDWTIASAFHRAVAAEVKPAPGGAISANVLTAQVI